MKEAFGASDPGCVRPNNEDYYLIAPSLGLYLVADGMGGAQAGEHASKIASEAIAEFIWRSGPSPENIVAAVEDANRRVLTEAASDPALQGMGTTMVVALDFEGQVHIVSVGDSRAYVLQDRKIRAITEDQTWVNEIGRRLGIDDAALKNHPMRHVLTMAIGVTGQLRINHYQLTLTAGSQVLLCSDGLHSVVEDRSIETVLQMNDSAELKCQRLIELARQAGGPDNITTVLLSL